MTVSTPKYGMGAPVLRKEDRSFITGRGCYTDDISVPGQLHGYVLRSPVANARFTITDIEAARAAPGVKAILTARDIPNLGALKTLGMQQQPDGSKAPTRDIPILCEERVRYVGDAIAFIVAETRAQAQDAAELIEVEYDDEGACIDTASALDGDSPLVWPDLKTNRAFHYRVGNGHEMGEVSAADHVVEISYRNNRLVSNYIEPRAAIAEFEAKDGVEKFKLTTGSQGVHIMRDILAEQVFGISKEHLRVVTPDVGGGFGPKTFTYREYVLVMEAARRLGRPVKWTGDRTEHFLTDAHGRDNAVKARMRMDANGRFLALEVEVVANMGAYLSQFAPNIPFSGVSMTSGVYDIPYVDVSVHGVYTNTCPVDAYRGAGRPEAAFLIEKLVDECARAMGLSPDEIRRRNFIKPEAFPYRTPTGRTYDVGEFEGHMDLCMERADWAGFPARARQAKERGRIRGIGMATYVEACAFAGSEPARINLNEDGTVTVYIGTQSNGQGHVTAYAQLAAEQLGMPIDMVHVHQGDTDKLDQGGGTHSSRSIPLGGVSVVQAGDDLASKLRKLAANELEASHHDIELVEGVAKVMGTDRAVSFGDLYAKATSPDHLEGRGEFQQAEATYPNGTHICEVEIDPDTGSTEIVGYWVVDDFGVTVNPILLKGQVVGGIAQGVGQALIEDVVYSPDGQLLTATFMDYAIPRADILPFVHFETRNVPSTTNAMGMKGAGEAGTTGSTPAALNAVVDALWREYGIRHVEMPATPQRVWAAIQACSQR